MFMIDLYPANRERFGINMDAIIETLNAERQAYASSTYTGSTAPE